MLRNTAAILTTGLLVGFLAKVTAPLKNDRYRVGTKVARSLASNTATTSKMAASFAEVILAINSTNSTIIDVRPKFAYEQGHIGGARNIPTYDELIKALIKLQKERRVLIYGERPDARIYDAVRATRTRSPLAIQVYEGGWSEWTNLGLHSIDSASKRKSI